MSPVSALRPTPAMRCNFWRFDRELFCAASGEVVDGPTKNGEYWLLSRVLERMPAGTRRYFENNHVLVKKYSSIAAFGKADRWSALNAPLSGILDGA